jgi:CheY-like chemotaxis protein
MSRGTPCLCSRRRVVSPPVMVWIGELWEQGAITVADEHLAIPQFAGIPIIVISARDPRETEVLALAAGATCFLPKPLDLDRFAETVIRLVDG